MARRGTTLFERWKARRADARLDTEQRFYNPLDLRVGALISLNLEGLEDLDFQVLTLREVKRVINDQPYLLADYDLRAYNLEGQEFRYRLRLVPLEEPDLESGLTHLVILLSPVDSFEYDEGVQGVLDADEGYVVSPGTDQEAVFPTRVQDISEPYDTEIAVVSDENHDGQVEDDEVERFQDRYWDFWRNAAEEGDPERVEYLFVDVSQRDGWTEIWQGPEISPEDVEILGKD